MGKYNEVILTTKERPQPASREMIAYAAQSDLATAPVHDGDGTDAFPPLQFQDRVRAHSGPQTLRKTGIGCGGRVTSYKAVEFNILLQLLEDNLRIKLLEWDSVRRLNKNIFPISDRTF